MFPSRTARETEVLEFLWTLKVGQKIIDIEARPDRFGVVSGHLKNGYPLIQWDGLDIATAAGWGTRRIDANIQ